MNFKLLGKLTFFVCLLSTYKCYVSIEASQTQKNNFTAIPCNDPNCKQCWPLNETQCGSCKDSYVADNIQNVCATCESKITNCTLCTFNSLYDMYLCSVCVDQSYPYPLKNNCTSCNVIFDKCVHCATVKKDFTTYISCDQCTKGHQVNSNGLCVVPPQSNPSIIIIISVIGGLVVLAGIGFGVFKYLNRKKKESILLQTNDQQ